MGIWKKYVSCYTRQESRKSFYTIRVILQHQRYRKQHRYPTARWNLLQSAQFTRISWSHTNMCIYIIYVHLIIFHWDPCCHLNIVRYLWSLVETFTHTNLSMYATLTWNTPITSTTQDKSSVHWPLWYNWFIVFHCPFDVMKITML